MKVAEHVLTKHKVAIKILNRRKIRQMDMEEKGQPKSLRGGQFAPQPWWSGHLWCLSLAWQAFEQVQHQVEEQGQVSPGSHRALVVGTREDTACPSCTSSLSPDKLLLCWQPQASGVWSQNQVALWLACNSVWKIQAVISLLRLLAWHQHRPNRHLPTPIEGWLWKWGC